MEQYDQNFGLNLSISQNWNSPFKFYQAIDKFW